jgi:hypothetical protein
MVGPTKTPAIYENTPAWCEREQPKDHNDEVSDAGQSCLHLTFFAKIFSKFPLTFSIQYAIIVP